MKLVKTNFEMNVNESSSWIIYITKNAEDAQNIYNMCMTQKEIMNDWYYTISMNKVCKDCRVPTFFHDREYWMVAVEHNNGDWNKKPTYTLYIAE